MYLMKFCDEISLQYNLNIYRFLSNSLKPRGKLFCLLPAQNLFVDMNAKKPYHDRNSIYYYNQVHTQEHGNASKCIKCGK